MENLFDISTDLGAWVLTLGAIVTFLIIFFVPNLIATELDHPAFGGVFIVNLLVGWTALGWIAAFIWALTETQSEAACDEPTKTCPDCAEEVKAAARICRFCGFDFNGSR